jgi:branched-chain amino acid transport system permease protein
MVIGLAQRYAIGYSPGGGFLSRVQDIIPMIVLFVVLIVLPHDRLRSATFAGAVAPRTAGFRSSVVWGVILVVGAFVVSGHLSPGNLLTATNAFALAFILLSLVLLTGYGGLVSLGQLTFVGLGSFMMGHFGHHGSLLGVVAAVALTAAVGALIALPTLRMRGLYLALATLAFASVMDSVFFTNQLGTGGSLNVDRVRIPGIPTQSDRAFFMLCAVVFALGAIGVLALRRGPFGRRLVALNDSPAACATLGMNVNWTKLVVFALSAGMAGLGGVLFGGATTIVTANSFIAFLSLVILLLARIGGINTATGAFLGAFVFALFPVLQQHVPQLANLQYLLTGLAAISIGRDPNGLGGKIAMLAERVRPGRRPSASALAAAPAYPQPFEQTAYAEEDEGLVHASR